MVKVYTNSKGELEIVSGDIIFHGQYDNALQAADEAKSFLKLIGEDCAEWKHEGQDFTDVFNAPGVPSLTPQFHSTETKKVRRTFRQLKKVRQ